MHIFDIRRSNSVTEIWKKFEQRPQPPVLQRAEVDDGQRTEDPPSPTFEDGDALNPDLCTSASAQPSEPLLAAFEAELAKILDETSSSSNADHAQDGPQSSAEAQPRTNTDEPTTPGDAFAQAVHNLVNGAQLIRSGVRSRIPDLERQLRDVQRAVPEHVESTLQLALTTMESRVRNMTEAIHNTAPARVQRTNNLFWGECPVAATTVDGLRTMASEIGQMGQTLFTTFESELGYNTSRDQVQNHSGEAHGSSQLGGEATTDEPSADHPEYAPNTQQSHPNVPFEDEKESLDASRVGRGSSSQTRPHDGLDHADPPSQSQQSNMSQTPTSRQDGHAQQHPSLGAHHRPHMDIPPRIPAFPRPAPFYSPSYLPPPGPFHAPNPPPPPPPVPPFQTSPFHSSFWQPPQPAPSLWSRFPPHPPPPPHLRRAWQSGWPLGPKYNQDDSGVAAASTPGNSRNEPAVQTRSSTNKTLFIGNVGFRVTEKMIQGVFAAQGFLVDVHLPLDSETKEHAGFGYLHFASTYAAKAALEALQGTHIDGHSINLEFSDHSPIPNIQTPRDNEESTSQTHPDVRKASTDTRNSNPLSPRQLIDDSAEESTEQSSSKNTKSAASNASTNDQATNTYPRASALLDRDNEDVEFSTRYPSLIPEASSRGPRIPTTGRLPRLSPESEMNRFPPVSQLDAHMVANQRQDAESSSRPRVPNVPTGQGSRHPVNNSPPFDIPETHNRPHPHHGWRHLDTSDRRQSGRLLRRSNTMIPAHPASRLSGPFDPLAPAESNNSPKELRRRATERRSLRASAHKSRPGFSDFATFHEHPASNRDMRYPPTINRIDECVAALASLGYGGAEEGGHHRLAVYAAAADGKVNDAIEMIEDERKVYAQRR